MDLSKFLPIPETKRSRLLELGFELISNSAILSAILTANVKKYCNPRAPDSDAFNGDTADASLMPTLVIDSLIPDSSNVKMTEGLEQTTTAAPEVFEQAPTSEKCSNSNVVEGLPTQTQDSQLVPSDYESQQYSQETDNIVLQPIKFQGRSKVKMEQTTRGNTDLRSSQQRKVILPSENQHKSLSGQVMVEPASVPTNSENDDKRFASIMARRRRRGILPSQSQSMDISDDDNGDDNEVEEISTAQHKDKPSAEEETQPASKDDDELTRGFVKSTVKKENQEMHLDSESFIDVEYIDVSTLHDSTQEPTQNNNDSPLHHFASFDSNRSNTGAGTTYNAKRFRKQRIFHSDDPQQVSHETHNGQSDNSGIIEMHETIEFEETVANADCPENECDDDDDDLDNELINITAAVTASSRRRAAVGTKRKRVIRASSRSTITRLSGEDDHDDDDDDFEPVSTRSRRRTTRK